MSFAGLGVLSSDEEPHALVIKQSGIRRQSTAIALLWVQGLDRRVGFAG